MPFINRDLLRGFWSTHSLFLVYRFHKAPNEHTTRQEGTRSGITLCQQCKVLSRAWSRQECSPLPMARRTCPCPRLHPALPRLRGVVRSHTRSCSCRTCPLRRLKWCWLCFSNSELSLFRCLFVNIGIEPSAKFCLPPIRKLRGVNFNVYVRRGDNLKQKGPDPISCEANNFARTCVQFYLKCRTVSCVRLNRNPGHITWFLVM